MFSHSYLTFYILLLREWRVEEGRRNKTIKEKKNILYRSSTRYVSWPCAMTLLYFIHNYHHKTRNQKFTSVHNSKLSIGEKKIRHLLLYFIHNYHHKTRNQKFTFVHNSGSSPEESMFFLWTSWGTHSSPGIGDTADTKKIID